jgi:putative tryptophan/tyrosine transport system substrate-binding protein
MNRRAILAALGGMCVFAATFRTAAQTVKGVHRIGILGYGTPYSDAEYQRLFDPMQRLGWFVGQNLIVERRWPSTAEALQSNAEELARLNVKMIVTFGTAATLAAKNATARIPILMAQAGDPVRTGLVESLNRPGGNITGYSLLMSELDAKSLTLLRELLPGIERVGRFVESANLYQRLTLEESERVFRSLGMRAIIVDIGPSGDVARAVAEAARQKAQALMIPLGDVFIGPNEAVVTGAAIKHALPTIAAHRDLVVAGALLSLMPDEAEQFQIFAYFADKILRGAKPADLPVQQPTKFLLSVNRKTAKALGLTVPQSILQRADEVIE